MSGFVGIVHLDGSPADGELLERLTAAIDYRGPDAHGVWVQRNAAFGHTMLRTTFEAARERQPCTLDGECWITADCRVDAREDLIRALASRGRDARKENTDPELILHAYAAWGTDCVHHLIGDFAFAIWDGRNRRLFCARDHMGIKLFHYAKKGNTLIFGNTLNCLRLHPSVTERLNDAAIADFLLFGSNLEPATTAFDDIRCLPPAHTMIWQEMADDPQIERYWTVPIDPPLRYRRSGDYIDHFLDLLRAAVRDRLRTDRVGLFMSGGIDSTGIAAIARELAGDPAKVDVQAYTAVFDRLIPDEERHYAGIAAAHLRIPVHFHPRDDDQILSRGALPGTPLADPFFVSEFGPDADSGVPGAIARQARVALYGEGPDNALTYEWKSYVKHELAHARYGTLLREAIAFPFLFGTVPLLRRLSRAPASSDGSAAYDGFPAWLNPEFAQRLRLRERIEHAGANGGASTVHPARPHAHAGFLTHGWRALFEPYDPGITRLPLEVRHPYLDVRMIRYLLAVPVIPWCRGKYLVRRAFRPYLPAAVTERPKTPVAAFPPFVSWQKAGCPALAPSDAVSGYVDVAALSAMAVSPAVFFASLRILALDIFLQSVQEWHIAQYFGKSRRKSNG